ncbi:MAG TPA: PQQ-binding-like beta-propeller repeat protein, partial [Polyangiaceae bacterium LLY-WYZ-15_(1-7)]|nr:PQQ-binding-like beta-propeller repeat protein [Polyangiaceae bacterium LLY-WYZ-15_(1-7)]
PRIGPPAPAGDEGALVVSGPDGLRAYDLDGEVRWEQQARDVEPLGASSRSGSASSTGAAQRAARSKALEAVRRASLLRALGGGGAAGAGGAPAGSARYRRRRPQPVVAADGTIYGADGPRTFARLDTDGRTRWRRRLDGPVAAAAALTSSAIFVPVNATRGGEASLVALEPDGALGWSADLPGALATAPLVDEDGAVVLSSWDPEEPGEGASAVVALDPSDGRERWRTDLGAGPLTDVTFAGEDLVLVAARSGVLVAVGRADGAERWRVDLGDWIGVLERPVAAADRVYASNRDGVVVAVDLEGEELWRRELGDGVIGGLALGPGGDVYAMTSAKQLWIHGAEGALRARVDLPRRADAVAPPSVTADGTVVFTGEHRITVVPRARVAEVERYIDGHTRCGPRRVSRNEDVAYLVERGCEWIDGSLEIEAAAVDLSPLSRIRYARALWLERPADLSGLAGLERVEHLNVVRAEGAIDTGALTGLRVIGRDLEVVASHDLLALSLPALERVDGSLTVRRNRAVERVELPRLREVGGRVRIDDDATLESLGPFPALERVGGPIWITDLERLRSIEGFGALEAIDGSLHVERVPELERLTGFRALASARHVVVADTPSLVALRGFDALSTADGVYVDGAPELATFAAFGALAEVAGDLRLHLGALASPASLPALREVEGDLELGAPEGVAVTAPRLRQVRGFLRAGGRFDAEALSSVAPGVDPSAVSLGDGLATRCHRTAGSEEACHTCCADAEQLGWSCAWRGWDGEFCACRFPRARGGTFSGLVGARSGQADEARCADRIERPRAR